MRNILTILNILLLVCIYSQSYSLIGVLSNYEENKKRKIGLERSSMQQADYQCHRPTP